MNNRVKNWKKKKKHGKHSKKLNVLQKGQESGHVDGRHNCGDHSRRAQGHGNSGTVMKHG